MGKNCFHKLYAWGDRFALFLSISLATGQNLSFPLIFINVYPYQYEIFEKSEQLQSSYKIVCNSAFVEVYETCSISLLCPFKLR